jgi:hypothetical protein
LTVVSIGVELALDAVAVGECCVQSLDDISHGMIPIASLHGPDTLRDRRAFR